MVRFGKSAVATVCLMGALLSDPCWAQRQRGASRSNNEAPVVLGARHQRHLKKSDDKGTEGGSSGKGGSGKGGEGSCGTDCKNTIPDFVKNILNLGFDEDTELLSGFGYCEGDFDANFDKLCCSASALRATIGGTWVDLLLGNDVPSAFIPPTANKPDFLLALEELTQGAESTRRRLNPADKKAKKPMVKVGETEALLDGLFKQDGLAEALETALGQPETRRRLGISDFQLDREGNKRHLQEFENDDGTVCVLAVVIAWFVEFYIGEELGSDGIPGDIAGGVGDAIRKIGCDISGLLTSKCEDFSPVINLDDFEGIDGVLEGYVASELSFLVCKLIKEAIAALALFIFSPWILPACYCDYRTAKGCSVSSCYDPVECCGGEVDTGFTLIPKPDLVDDINVAATQYFPFEAIGFTELLRSCNAIPGDRSYFVGRLPEGKIGGAVTDLLCQVLNCEEGAPALPLNPDQIAALETIGNCFDEAFPDETLAYEDALAAFNAIEAGVDAVQAQAVGDFVAALPDAVETCLNNDFSPGGAAGAGTVLLGALGNGLIPGGSSDFSIVLLIAISFFFAGGGEIENLTLSLPGILNELLGKDLIDAILNLELGGGIFPVRRGGEPIDKCLGYCFLQGGGKLVLQGGGEVEVEV